MPKMIKSDFGKLISCIDRQTGKEHTDWRAEYIGKNGMIILYESERKHPGWRFVYFFPYMEGANQNYLNTATSEYMYVENEDSFTLTSKNSIWTFAFGEFDLTENEKLELLLNVGGCV